VARASWVHDECTGQGERQRDSPSKRGGDEAVEMGFDTVFPVGGDAPVTLGGGDDLLEHQSRRGKVRCGPSEEEKVALRELTEGGDWRRQLSDRRR
jgi:hypothetical protein